MTTEESLLAAIRANPEDDVVRLAYADWLDEQPVEVECGNCDGLGGDVFCTGIRCPICEGSGQWRSGVGFEHEKICLKCDQEWEPGGTIIRQCRDCTGTGRVSSGNRELAEFIRVQVGHGLPLRRQDDGGQIPTDTRRDAEILDEHGKELVKTAAAAFCLSAFGVDHGYFGSGGVHFVWQRGFIAEIYCPLDTWMQHGPAIVRCPVACVERVEITDRQPFVTSGNEWGWFDGGHRTIAVLVYELQQCIFEMLSKGYPRHGPGYRTYYATEAEAIDALSAACIKWAWNQNRGKPV